MKLGYGEDEKSFDMEKVRKCQVQQHFFYATRHDFVWGVFEGTYSLRPNLNARLHFKIFPKIIGSHRPERVQQ
jgi:hypothetical protein